VEDVEAFDNLKNVGMPVVVILISGRPMIINDVLDYADAFIAAWLPGTEGQRVAATRILTKVTVSRPGPTCMTAA